MLLHLQRRRPPVGRHSRRVGLRAWHRCRPRNPVRASADLELPVDVSRGRSPPEQKRHGRCSHLRHRVSWVWFFFPVLCHVYFLCSWVFMWWVQIMLYLLFINLFVCLFACLFLRIFPVVLLLTPNFQMFYLAGVFWNFACSSRTPSSTSAAPLGYKGYRLGNACWFPADYVLLLIFSPFIVFFSLCFPHHVNSLSFEYNFSEWFLFIL